LEEQVKKYSAALLAVALAAVMLLAGCGGGAQADGAPPPNTGSPPTTPTASPTTTSATPTTVPAPTTDPDIPDAARARTPAGAEAFVHYFFETLNLAWTTPRAGILSPLCQGSSKSCAANESTATELTKAGHHYDGNPVTVKSVRTLSALSPNKYDVLATVVAEPVREVDGVGKAYVTERREKLSARFVLLYTDQAWSAMSIKKMK
jgi:hypothetical protein